MRTTVCPKPAALTSIPDLTCPQSFGQIQKIAFTRKGNPFTTEALAITKSEWVTRLAALDDTKMIITPFLSGFDTEPGKAKEYGSGNEMRNGIPMILRNDPTKVSAKLFEYDSDCIKAIKKLYGEDVEVYLFNEAGWIGCQLDGTKIKGIPIQSLNISDLKLGGFDAPDFYDFSCQFPQNWSDDWKVLDPTTNFNALEL